MGPSQSQLKLLSPEDRVVYRRWLRGSLLFYGSLMAFLAVVTVASHVFIRSLPSDVASDALRTASISARK